MSLDLWENRKLIKSGKSNVLTVFWSVIWVFFIFYVSILPPPQLLGW